MALQRIRQPSPGIVQDPTINSGRPIIEGTRVFVDLILGHIESGMSLAEICQEYDLTPAQVRQAVACGAHDWAVWDDDLLYGRRLILGGSDAEGPMVVYVRPLDRRDGLWECLFIGEHRK